MVAIWQVNQQQALCCSVVELRTTLSTNFGGHAQMVTEFGGCILAARFGFVPDCTLDASTCKLEKLSYIHVTATRWGKCLRSLAGRNGLPYLQSLLVASGVGWA